MHLSVLSVVLALASSALATGSAKVNNNCGSTKYISITRAGPGETAHTFAIGSKKSWSEVYQGTGNSIGITNGMRICSNLAMKGTDNLSGPDYYSPNESKLIWGQSERIIQQG